MDIGYPEINIILYQPLELKEKGKNVFLGKLLRAVAVADGMPGKC